MNSFVFRIERQLEKMLLLWYRNSFIFKHHERVLVNRKVIMLSVVPSHPLYWQSGRSGGKFTAVRKNACPGREQPGCQE